MAEFTYSNAEKEMEVYRYDSGVKSHCRMCHGGCGVLVFTQNGKVQKIAGDPDCPINHGTLCSKGIASAQLAYHPDRLTYPLKRIGPKASGKWERISWDEALDTIAERILYYKENFGAESIVMGYGTGRENEGVIYRFANLLGTPNVLTAGHFCYGPRIATGIITCGSNLIVVDPRLTRIAARADTWLQLRPGTDTALALGMLNVIINERLYDKEFVENYVHGWAPFIKRVNEYPLDMVNGKLNLVFQINVCRHCDAPPCAEACFDGAITKREDGIVVMDYDRCTGCKVCIEACPYDAIAFDMDKFIAQKCNLCHHRVDKGLLPACADNVCLAHCIHFGDPEEIKKGNHLAL